MAIDEFQITNNSNGKIIKLHFASGVEDNITINNVSFSSPGQKADENYVANFGGFKDLITIDFVLKNDGSVKSNDGSGIITLKQQRDYLKNIIIQGTGTGDSVSDITYTVRYYTPDGSSDETGGIEGINLRWSPSESNIYRGSLTLIKGTN